MELNLETLGMSVIKLVEVEIGWVLRGSATPYPVVFQNVFC